jgi:hypothetical protein
MAALFCCQVLVFVWVEYTPLIFVDWNGLLKTHKMHTQSMS